MAKADESIIQQAKREWEEANARGDEEGKKAAPADARKGPRSINYPPRAQNGPQTANLQKS